MNSSYTPRPAATVGTLYGIGVGPGDTDLLTVKAIKLLHHVDVILAAASPRNDASLALNIARPHLPEGAVTQRLDFPMTRDKSVLHDAWQHNAEIVAELLRQGKNLVFLTLGDPLIYSTFGYLLRTLRAIDDTLPIEVVPGITSYQAAAAKTGTILCEGSENLLLLAGINDEETLNNALEIADSAVILKAYKNCQAIYAALEKAERGETSLFASKLGLEGERLAKGLVNAPQAPHYLSLVLAPPKRS